MRVALMSYHKNVHELYPLKWLEDYRDSVLAQTFKDFDVYEINYGLMPGMIFWNSRYESRRFPTFVHCMNYLLDKLFNDGYDVVFNSNVDDLYEPTWMERQLSQIKNAELVSCNFTLFNQTGVYHSHRFEKVDIEKELSKNHNPICHPGVCYTKKFWDLGNRYIPEEIPYEDMELWKRAIKNSRFIIHPDSLVHHRIHGNSVCKSENR